MKTPSRAPNLFGLFVVLLLPLLAKPAAAAAANGLPPASPTTAAFDPFTAASEMGPIAAGWLHSCALTPAGGVICWGRNDYGQLGNNSTADSSVPVHVVGLSSGVSALAAGVWHTCALTTTGGMFCWGGNSLGQLGDHSFKDSLVPVAVWGLPSGVSAIAAGFFHTCALAATGGVKCWGHNGNGQVGDNTNYVRTVPTDVWGLAGGVSGIAAGMNHTCALITDGGVKCWGDNLFGQLGDDSTTNSIIPVDVHDLSGGLSAIAAGDYHTCALTPTGGVKCWGCNNSGQLGQEPTFGSPVPVEVGGLPGPVSAIAAGGAHNCALTPTGGMSCWGADGSGELGRNDGGAGSRWIPQQVWGLSGGVRAMALGQVHTCALTATGIKCWGANYRGQLGNGSTTNSDVPVDVAEPAAPELAIEYTAGRPGSFFKLTGGSFPASGSLALAANGHLLGDTVSVNADGSFVVWLSTADADVGWYRLTAADTGGGAAQAGLGPGLAGANPGSSVSFVLEDGAPLRPQSGSGQTLVVPAGIAVPAHRLSLPLLLRQGAE